METSREVPKDEKSSAPTMKNRSKAIKQKGNGVQSGKLEQEFINEGARGID